MDIIIDIDGQEKGTIPYDALAAYYYLFHECGFQVQLDQKKQKLQLSAGLAGKKISIAPVMNPHLNSYRKKTFEQKMLEQIQRFLTSSGAEVILQKENETPVKGDLHFMFALMEMRKLKEPIFELSFNSNHSNRKWLTVLKNECRKNGAAFHSKELIDQSTPNLTIHLKYPETTDESFWLKYGESYAIMITMGILARLQGDSPLELLSYLPLKDVPFLLGTTIQTKQKDQLATMPKQQKTNSKPNTEQPKKVLRKEGEVFFDYHTLLEKDLKNFKILVDLDIKNTGTEPLRNPVICLRTSPVNSIKVTGQILPPNVSNTMGMVNETGARGWKYMNDNWFEEAEEKGEFWICPIQQMVIFPNQIESLQNIQITLLNTDEQDHIKIEGFVFFRDQGLELEANNQISFSF